MKGILKLAFKLLVNDKAKFTALLVGITFAVFLMLQVTSMFSGVMARASATVFNLGASVWIMDTAVQTAANSIGMPDYVLDAARSMQGVSYAVPLYSGTALVKLNDGNYQAATIVGLDDSTLYGRPILLQGRIEDIYGENAFIVIKDPEFSKLENPQIGTEFQVNDHRGVIVGIARVVSGGLFGIPTLYTTYQRALQYLPNPRFTISYVLVEPKSAADIPLIKKQAEAQLKATQAEDTNVEVLRAQYEHAIAVLTGQPPETFSIAVEAVQLTSPAFPVGVPSQLLERRPDIASAERSVAQANTQIGVAKSAFFPQLLLSATGGFQSVSISEWFQWPSRVWSVGPSLAQTLFDGGLRRATVQQYQAVYDETVANYRQTVLTAFQQVEDNLAAVRILEQVILQQDSAVESAARSLSEADVRYRAGIDPYLNVIAAQTILLNNQESAVTFREQQMTASVQLVRALGGGWDVAQLH